MSETSVGQIGLDLVVNSKEFEKQVSGIQGIAKKAGYQGGIRTAGFVCSVIGVIGSAIIFVACVACVGVVGTAGLMDSL